MIRSHQEQVGNLYKSLLKLKADVNVGWNDDNSKRFYHKNLDPLQESILQYSISVNKYFDQLSSAMSQINKLIGSPFPFPIDPYQHIRER